MDPVQFISQDVITKITKHLEKIRLSQKSQYDPPSAVLENDISSTLPISIELTTIVTIYLSFFLSFFFFYRENREKVGPTILSSFLRSRQSEKDLLRKLADVMIVNLFPRSYVDCFLLRHALRELLAIQGSSKFNLVDLIHRS